MFVAIYWPLFDVYHIKMLKNTNIWTYLLTTFLINKSYSVFFELKVDLVANLLTAQPPFFII